MPSRALVQPNFDSTTRNIRNSNFSRLNDSIPRHEFGLGPSKKPLLANSPRDIRKIASEKWNPLQPTIYKWLAIKWMIFTQSLLIGNGCFNHHFHLFIKWLALGFQVGNMMRFAMLKNFQEGEFCEKF